MQVQEHHRHLLPHRDDKQQWVYCLVPTQQPPILLLACASMMHTPTNTKAQYCSCQCLISGMPCYHTAIKQACLVVVIYQEQHATTVQQSACTLTWIGSLGVHLCKQIIMARMFLLAPGQEPWPSWSLALGWLLLWHAPPVHIVCENRSFVLTCMPPSYWQSSHVMFHTNQLPKLCGQT